MYLIQPKYKYFILLCLSILFCACKKTNLGIILPYEDKKLVVYSELSPDKNIGLYLNRTYPPTGDIKVLAGLSGAKITLFEDGISKGQLSYIDSGNYTIPIKPVAGKSYFFKISLDGYSTTVSEGVEIPKAVTEIKITFGETLYNTSSYYENIRRCGVEWKDNNSQKDNSYLVSIDGLYKNVDVYNYVESIGSQADVENGCSFSTIQNGFLYRGLCYDTQAVKVELGVSSSGILQQNIIATNEKVGQSVKVELYRVFIRAVSDSYYQYLRTETEPLGILKAFSIPQTRYSNIKNGYGIVVAHNRTMITVRSM